MKAAIFPEFTSVRRFFLMRSTNRSATGATRAMERPKHDTPYPRGFIPAMRKIAILNQKGGVGKTTLVANLGAGLARQRKRMRLLLVDLDPQAHLTYSLGLAAHELKTSIYELLQGQAVLSEALVEIKEGLHLIPASLDLASAELEFAAVPGREFLLKELLAEVEGYDYILIDCPPNLGLLTINALTMAEEVIIPVQTEFLALQSLSRLLETIQVVQKRLNPGLAISGMVATRYAKRKNLNREVVENLRQHFGKLVYKTIIRDNVSLAEAPSHGLDIFSYKPRSYGAEDFTALSREFARRGKAMTTRKPRMGNNPLDGLPSPPGQAQAGQAPDKVSEDNAIDRLLDKYKEPQDIESPLATARPKPGPPAKEPEAAEPNTAPKAKTAKPKTTPRKAAKPKAKSKAKVGAKLKAKPAAKAKPAPLKPKKETKTKPKSVAKPKAKTGQAADSKVEPKIKAKAAKTPKPKPQKASPPPKPEPPVAAVEEQCQSPGSQGQTRASARSSAGRARIQRS